MTAGNVALTAHIAKKQQHKLPGASRRGAQARLGSARRTGAMCG